VANSEGVKRVDLIIEHGRIAAILPAGSAPVGALFDADNGQAWPTFADLHAHLDKGHIIPRAANRDGTLNTARLQTRADTMSKWKIHDVEARFEFALRTAYAHGTSVIRTHIDCFVTSQAPVSFNVFRHLRERWAGRTELQAVALVSPDLYQDPANASIIDIIAEVGGKLGCVVYSAAPRAAARRRVVALQEAGRTRPPGARTRGGLELFRLPVKTPPFWPSYLPWRSGTLIHYFLLVAGKASIA
jgi:cytosine/creatinine deaminase